MIRIIFENECQILSIFDFYTKQTTAQTFILWRSGKRLFSEGKKARWAKWSVYIMLD